jgi:hypothetical protein
VLYAPLEDVAVSPRLVTHAFDRRQHAAGITPILEVEDVTRVFETAICECLLRPGDVSLVQAKGRSKTSGSYGWRTPKPVHATFVLDAEGTFGCYREKY